MDMDEEFDIFEEKEIQFEDNEIIIRIDKRNAKKSTTLIENWNIPIDELKQHLKTLKTKLGCNGSVKNKDDEIKFQLQGDKKYEVIEYLKNNGINESKIKVIG